MSHHSLPPSLEAMLEEKALFEEKYRLLRFLGEGSFASVIHARHEAMDRDVALKFLRPDVIKAHPESSERFLTEVRVSSRLTSPHTVTIFDFGQTDEDIPYMVMEYVEGRPLDEAIDKYGALGKMRSIRMTLQILESLAEAHANRIIHRDLKPANIMVGKKVRKKKKKRLHVKVLDFGVAKLVEQSEEELKTESGRRSTQFIGTPRYMSPEQILGREVSPASDLYSLGLIFYEMCTGAESISEENVAQVAQAHLSEEPLQLEALDELPDVLADIVLKATARHPEERYEDAAQFSDALNEAMQTGKRKHKRATRTARQATPAEEKRKRRERKEWTSNVFSGESYVELPTEEEVDESRSPTGGGGLQRPPKSAQSSSGRQPSPVPSRKKKRRASTPGRKRSGKSSSSGNLELDMESVESQRRDIARKRLDSRRREKAQQRKEVSGQAWRWVWATSAIGLSGLVGFIIVGGALEILAFPMRLIMALLPGLLAFLWAYFSENAYPDAGRRVMVPWAKRSALMVPIAILALTVIMPGEAGRSLQEDALWFLAVWPEPLQMGWMASTIEAICGVTAHLMWSAAHLIPWSASG